jgi:hypothetical protein
MSEHGDCYAIMQLTASQLASFNINTSKQYEQHHDHNSAGTEVHHVRASSRIVTRLGGVPVSVVGAAEALRAARDPKADALRSARRPSVRGSILRARANFIMRRAALRKEKRAVRALLVLHSLSNNTMSR